MICIFLTQLRLGDYDENRETEGAIRGVIAVECEMILNQFWEYIVT